MLDFIRSNIEQLITVTLLIMAIITAFYVVISTNTINAIIILAAYSLICALLYLLMSAPDVALTEAAINACVSTCLLLAAQNLIRSDADESKNYKVPLILCALTFLMITYAVFTVSPYGNVESITNQNAAAYYIANTHKDVGIKSMVAAILASYRSYDTMGEILVILTSGIGVMMILGQKNIINRKNAK